MADASTASLWPVIVGGLLAMGGGAIGGGVQLLNRYLQSQEDRKKRRAEKFEELVQVLHEHKHWLDGERSRLVLGLPREETQSPLHKAVAIMTVYFPELAGKLDGLDLVARNYEIWMMERGQKRLEGEEVAKLKEGHLNVSRPYLEGFNKLMRELREYAERNFK